MDGRGTLVEVSRGNVGRHLADVVRRKRALRVPPFGATIVALGAPLPASPTVVGLCRRPRGRPQPPLPTSEGTNAETRSGGDNIRLALRGRIGVVAITGGPVHAKPRTIARVAAVGSRARPGGHVLAAHRHSREGRDGSAAEGTADRHGVVAESEPAGVTAAEGLGKRPLCLTHGRHKVGCAVALPRVQRLARRVGPRERICRARLRPSEAKVAAEAARRRGGCEVIVFHMLVAPPIRALGGVQRTAVTAVDAVAAKSARSASASFPTVLADTVTVAGARLAARALRGRVHDDASAIAHPTDGARAAELARRRTPTERVVRRRTRFAQVLADPRLVLVAWAAVVARTCARQTECAGQAADRATAPIALRAGGANGAPCARRERATIGLRPCRAHRARRRARRAVFCVYAARDSCVVSVAGVTLGTRFAPRASRRASTSRARAGGARQTGGGLSGPTVLRIRPTVGADAGFARAE